MRAEHNIPALDQAPSLGEVVARRNFCAVLLRRKSKRPTGEHWFTTSEQEPIDRHVRTGNNVGIVAGPKPTCSGLAILDTDQMEAWRDLVSLLDEPAPPWVRTGSGKLHYYVQWEPELPAKIKFAGKIIGEIQRGPTEDGDQNQQQVVAPPSIHPETGRAYEWLVDPLSEPLRPLPDVWRRYLRGEFSSPNGNGARVEIEVLRARALEQPGAKERAGGVKFQCPECRSEGHDQHQDNAKLFADGRWGCAVGDRPHWDAIGRELGAFVERTHAKAQAKPEERKPAGRYFLESLPDFVARVSKQPKPRYLVGELIPEGSTALCHGQPRAKKTLYGQHVGLCAALKAVPFALERFAVPEAIPVFHVSNEDGERMTMERFQMQLAAWGYSKLPENLFVSVRRGVDLDETEWQEALIEAAKRYGAKLTIFDPLRMLSSAVDQGPAELKPLAAFFRRYIDVTGSAILSVHHDVKPPRNQTDDRARPQRASGGGIFSISDAPVALELAGKKTLAAPTAFKFSEDPAPFTFDVIVTNGAMGLVGHNTTLAEAADFELSGKVLDYVAEHPGCSTEQIRKAVGRRKDAVKACLEKLVQEQRLDTTSGKRGADLWFPAGVSGSGTGPGTGGA